MKKHCVELESAASGHDLERKEILLELKDTIKERDDLSVKVSELASDIDKLESERGKHGDDIDDSERDVDLTEDEVIDHGCQDAPVEAAQSEHIAEGFPEGNFTASKIMSKLSETVNNIEESFMALDCTVGDRNSSKVGEESFAEEGPGNQTMVSVEMVSEIKCQLLFLQDHLGKMDAELRCKKQEIADLKLKLEEENADRLVKETEKKMEQKYKSEMAIVTRKMKEDMASNLQALEERMLMEGEKRRNEEYECQRLNYESKINELEVQLQGRATVSPKMVIISEAAEKEPTESPEMDMDISMDHTIMSGMGSAMDFTCMTNKNSPAVAGSSSSLEVQLLQSDLQDAKDTAERYKARGDELEEEVEGLKKAVQDLKENCSSQAASQEDDRKQLEQDLKECKDTAETYRGKCETMEKELEKVQNFADSLQEKLNIESEENIKAKERLQNELCEAKTMAESFKIRCDDLGKELEHLNLTLGGVSDQLQIEKTDGMAIQEKLQEMTDLANSYKLKCEELDKDLNELRKTSETEQNSQRMQLEEQLNAATGMADHYKVSCEELGSELEAHKNVLEQMKQEQDVHQEASNEKAEKLAVENNNLRDAAKLNMEKIEEMEKEIKSFHAKVAESSEANARLTQTKLELEAEKVSMEANLKTKINHLQELQKNHEEMYQKLCKDLSDFEQKAEVAKSEQEKLKSDHIVAISELEERLQEASSERNSLLQEKEKLSDEYNNLAFELEKFKVEENKKMTLLENEKSELREMLKQIQTKDLQESDSLQEKFSEDEIVTDLEARVAQLTSLNDGLQTEGDRLRMRNDAMADEFEKERAALAAKVAEGEEELQRLSAFSEEVILAKETAATDLESAEANLQKVAGDLAQVQKQLEEKARLLAKLESEGVQRSKELEENLQTLQDEHKATVDRLEADVVMHQSTRTDMMEANSKLTKELEAMRTENESLGGRLREAQLRADAQTGQAESEAAATREVRARLILAEEEQEKLSTRVQELQADLDNRERELSSVRSRHQDEDNLNENQLSLQLASKEAEIKELQSYMEKVKVSVYCTVQFNVVFIYTYKICHASL